ncbi:MAG: outer membrane beta-barrel protein [Deltaproteobacteria bacterium]|jgi:outer membrane protein W|nr:outer membrane beta-barrel protein [Deltaproteobacteria bacterium]
MRKIFFCLSAIAVVLISGQAYAGSASGNFSVGLGPLGNIYVVDSNPQLDMGAGGYVFFDYRWSPQFSTQFGVVVTTQDGTGISNGDNGIEFLGIPTFDLKFYIFSEPSRWDPYGLIGMGVYAVTEGSAKNGTTAVGIGANLGLGTDFYITEKWSVGLAAIFRSIGLIDSMGGSNNGTALFPFSMMGNVAYHF